MQADALSFVAGCVTSRFSMPPAAKAAGLHSQLVATGGEILISDLEAQVPGYGYCCGG
eukprot:CAMPEP_0203850210 /NCGR_PEP_ID=MMETSP0359-20131031/6644_1 /ASSEMBLY_ACC=CAM_ASM_000338 /TAXON_ID=268821 /ORGANISM="Scrippsiella Hangoei, Strain SHTV-5" /LENGTH=57 /DNA_ID=CAMNT_0050766079 /DNA_START=54 /DNA_END=224 /DNA_ORIENTATION=-